MPRNFKGGNKAKKGRNVPRFRKRTMITKGKDQLYGKVLARCGGKPPILKIVDECGATRLCVVRGKHTKKNWMNAGDCVLISTGDSKDTGEIDHKYSTSEVSHLQKIGELSKLSFKQDGDEKDNINIIFSNEDEKKDNFYTDYAKIDENAPKTFIALGDDSEDEPDDDFDFDL